jgi:ATP-dependent helicase/nuclease subunit B
MSPGTGAPALVEGAPHATLLQRAAALIVERHGDRLPDLSAVTVLVPVPHAVPELARALRQSAGTPALLLPTITTPEGLSASQPVATGRLAESGRRLLLFGILRDRGWVDAGTLWQAAGELVRLCEELSRHRIGLAATAEAFEDRVARACGRPGNTLLRFEARVVHETWRHLAGIGDAAFVHGAGLAAAAAGARGDLWLVDLPDMTPAEDEFVLAWRRRYPVHVLRGTTDGADDSLGAALAAAWGRPDVGPLRTRARDFASRNEAAPFASRVALCGAPTLELQAATAQARILAWLAAGRSRIAVVALDRVVARRLRALLERHGVLVQDETGWTLSTVAAATVVARWLDCVGGEFRHRDVLDLLKSPYLFSDWSDEARKQAAWEVEHTLRSRNLSGMLDRFAAAVSHQRPGGWGERAMERLREAAAAMPSRQRPAAGWLAALSEALQLLGVPDALAADAAGREVLRCLQRLRREAEVSRTVLDLHEWRQWLDMEFEAALFRDRDVRSPLVLTHLAALRLRRFDGVVLLGADAARLPDAGAPGVFLNEAVRVELGLPSVARHRARVRDDLAAALLCADETLVTWQDRNEGEPVPPSPWLDLLDAFHELAFGASLRTSEWLQEALRQESGAPEDFAAPLPVPGRMPRPRAPDLLPERVSVSACAMLVACPYRFFAARLLGLEDLDDWRDGIGKRDYGELVHRILLLFHQRAALAPAGDREARVALLEEVSREVFDEAAHEDPLARAWARRWSRHIAAYVDFQLEREAQGLQWQAGEQVREVALPLADGGVIRLHGRIDRIDRVGDGRVALIDYKTQAAARLREAVAAGEDVQLSCYGILEPAASAASYVCLEQRRVDVLPIAGDLEEAAAREAQRLSTVFSRLRAGHPLPANGHDEVCTHCEMRGLCRRDQWSEVA